jgi:hypothetical protein
LSEEARSGRDWEAYFDYLCKQFHAGKDTDEFKKVLHMCEAIAFDHDLQNPNEVNNASDNASISDINWQAQALQLSNDDDDDLNQGYHGNSNWDNLGNNGLQPQAGSSVLTLSLLLSMDPPQLPPPKEASQPSQLQTAMTTQGITCLSTITKEQAVGSLLSFDDPLPAVKAPQENSKKKLLKANMLTAAVTAAKPAARKTTKKMQVLDTSTPQTVAPLNVLKRAPLGIGCLLFSLPTMLTVVSPDATLYLVQHTTKSKGKEKKQSRSESSAPTALKHPSKQLK